MKPCTKVGLDITWRCNWRCTHCFYLRNAKLHKVQDATLIDIEAKIIDAKSKGMDHVVLIGQGEPSLHPDVISIILKAREHNMAISMITNGSAGIDTYESFFECGLDHLHISSHGYREALNKISGRSDAFDVQGDLKNWLQRNGLPFRTNITMQQLNYQQLPDVADYEISKGVYHFVFLGFLPHYEWSGFVDTVGVHPGLLRPYIEKAADKLLEAGTLFTIRYHPLCHLSPKYWKYVVNARYVPYDPFEWNYITSIDPVDVRDLAIHLGESVANKCDGCKMRLHCGGWNRIMAKAFDGARLRPITIIPEEYKSVYKIEGGLHDLNPVNQHSGTLCKKP